MINFPCERILGGGKKNTQSKLPIKMFFLGIVVLGMSFYCFRPANDASALTVSPPTYEIGVDPGQSVTTGLKVFNETTQGGTFYFDTQNFTARGEDGEPDFAQETTKTDLASWIQVPPSIDLAPNELKEINFSINVPANADPGGHYAAIFLTTSPGAPGGGAGSVGLTGKIGSLVLLRVSGNIVEEGKLSSFSVGNKNNFYDRLPVDFNIRIENPGTVFIKPSGKITISNIFGLKSAELTVNIGKMPDGNYKPVGNILSNSARKFESSWIKSDFGSAPNNFFDELKFELANFALGRYTAKLDLAYGAKNDKKIAGSLVFWVFPWRIILVGFVMIAVVLLLLIGGIRKYNRWVIKMARESLEKESKK
jgi:hypothetical protein